MESCRTGAGADDRRYVVPCNAHEVGMVRTKDQMPKQSPFAVVVGCSDARVPTEMLFGQGFNDLFVIRVAGNVLGDECFGSIDFALNVLSESVKVVVVLGHSSCGAVTGAVDAYLDPLKFWSKTKSPMLRGILQRIFVPVREAANGLEKVWGSSVREHPNYRKALIEAAVGMNAAQSAYNLHWETERTGRLDTEVLYGVYNIFTHRVGMPGASMNSVELLESRLAYAPTNPREFKDLAVRIAESVLSEEFTSRSKPDSGSQKPNDIHANTDNGERVHAGGADRS
jgi:carbonic anhydrase